MGLIRQNTRMFPAVQYDEHITAIYIGVPSKEATKNFQVECNLLSNETDDPTSSNLNPSPR